MLKIVVPNTQLLSKINIATGYAHFKKVFIFLVCPRQNCKSRIMEHQLIHWNKRVKVGLQTVLYCGCDEVPEMHYHCPNAGC